MIEIYTPVGMSAYKLDCGLAVSGEGIKTVRGPKYKPIATKAPIKISLEVDTKPLIDAIKEAKAGMEK